MGESTQKALGDLIQFLNAATTPDLRTMMRAILDLVEFQAR
jgi:hypothetical protein